MAKIVMTNILMIPHADGRGGEWHQVDLPERGWFTHDELVALLGVGSQLDIANLGALSSLDSAALVVGAKVDGLVENTIATMLINQPTGTHHTVVYGPVLLVTGRVLIEPEPDEPVS